jgi:hypothetical protein
VFLQLIVRLISNTTVKDSPHLLFVSEAGNPIGFVKCQNIARRIVKNILDLEKNRTSLALTSSFLTLRFLNGLPNILQVLWPYEACMG